MKKIAVFFFLFLIVFSVNGNLIGDDINTCPSASDDGNILDEGGITNGNVLSNDIDSDGDLLPDMWEIQYGLNRHSAAILGTALSEQSLDLDEDGLNNLINLIISEGGK